MPATLAGAIDSIIGAPPLHRTHWGILVRDAASGRDLYRAGAHRHFVPASNTKLVIATTALGTLGPDHRFETPVYADAAWGDTVATRLLVAGSGDPTLSARFHASEFAPLDSLAAAVAAAGIRAAHELVIDASRFDDARVHPTWEVGDLPFGYAAPVGAFAIAEGTFAVERAPGAAPGEPARLGVLGGDALQPIRSLVRTDTAGARSFLEVDYLSRRDTITFSGAVALDARPDTSRFAVTDPDLFAGRAFAAALRTHGVRVDSVRVIADSAGAAALRAATPRTVARLESARLDTIVAVVLRPSQNWVAEQLLRSLGAAEGGRGSWAAGIAAERRYLVDIAGIDSLAFSLRDASGLSAQNLLSPEAIVALLEHARRQPWSDRFRAALAAPGLRGSTLSNRLEPLEGRVLAKTGSIANVNSLSGYIVTDGGRHLSFSILTNGSGVPSAAVRQAIDAIVAAIARLGDAS
jgi:D-alanyl-D-alanine carboxypeptidase/D-alanyl-D-alanine-endopeptidase (penicillin-binding protein 4)